MTNGLLKSGSYSTGADVRAFLRVSKAAVAAIDHQKDSHLSNCVNGAAMSPYPRMNFL
jgi:hypothetical protein